MSDVETNETTDKPSRRDVIDSLTGFEEIGIEERFGATPGQLLESSLSKLNRALIYVLALREGKKSGSAYNYAMGLRLSEVGDYFAPFVDDDDFDATDPDTEQGKDDSPSDS